jgi:hypothetical protein
MLINKSVQEYVEHKADFEHEYYQELNTLKQVDMATLQKDPEAMRLAKNTFSQYCQSIDTFF